MRKAYACVERGLWGYWGDRGKRWFVWSFCVHLFFHLVCLVSYLVASAAMADQLYRVSSPDRCRVNGGGLLENVNTVGLLGAGTFKINHGSKIILSYWLVLFWAKAFWNKFITLKNIILSTKLFITMLFFMSVRIALKYKSLAFVCFKNLHIQI